jgi:hypothetical protein
MAQRLTFVGTSTSSSVTPAETIEFPVLRTADERMPFAGGEPEHRALGVLAVADADPAPGRLATSTQLPLEKLRELLTQDSSAPNGFPRRSPSVVLPRPYLLNDL